MVSLCVALQVCGFACGISVIQMWLCVNVCDTGDTFYCVLVSVIQLLLVLMSVIQYYCVLVSVIQLL